MSATKRVHTLMVSIVLAALCISVGAQAQSQTFIDELEFSISDEGFWGPGSGDVAEGTFRYIYKDVDDRGSVGGFLGADIDALPATRNGGTQFICPEGTFPDLDPTSQSCWACPAGYTQNLIYPPDDSRVCWQWSDFTTANLAGDAQFVCPAGQFPDALLQNCYSCPSGTSHDPLIPVDLPGACKTNTTASRQNGNALFCDSGDFPNGSLTACYDCPSGFDHNFFLSVNTRGVCSDSYWKQDCSNQCYLWNLKGDCIASEEVCGLPYLVIDNRTARYQYDLGCSGSSFDGGIENPNACYSCPAGTTHNPLLSVSTPGVCFTSAIAKKEGETGFICNSDEFLDTQTGACYSCQSDFSHNPALFASTPGVCFKENFSVAEEEGTEGFICPVGEFLDANSGQCYSCPDDYDWNPLVPADDSGACVNWSSLNVQGNPEDASFEIGFKYDFETRHIEGIEGKFILDRGSIDVDFNPGVKVEIKAKQSDDGNEHYLISTRQLGDENEDLTLKTIWPGMEIHIDPFKDIDSWAEGELRNVEFDLIEGWQQKIRTFDIFNESTDGEQRINPDHPMLKFRLDGSGLDIAVDGAELSDISFNSTFDPPIELTDKFFTRPASDKGKIVTAGIPVVEFGVAYPKMDTPPVITTNILDRENKFRAVFTENITLGEDAEETSVEQSIVASKRSGAQLGVLGGSTQETDFLRLDLDLDGMLALLLTGGNLALGYKASVPSPIPLIDYATLSASLLDADAGLIFSFHEDLRFDPNLHIILEFSVPVLLESTPGEGYQRLSNIRIPVGQDLQFIHPGGELTVSSRYSLDANTFDSDVDMMLTPLLEMEILSLDARILFLPKELLPKMVAIKLSQELTPEPVKIADMHDDSWSLQGFSDIRGSSLIISGTNDQPVARCQDTSVTLDAAGLAALSVKDIDNGSSDFNGEPLASLSLSRNQFSCADLGVRSISLSVIDGAGAEASCVAKVDVIDALAPLGKLPLSLILDEGDVYKFDVDITDNCGNISFEWAFKNGSISLDPSPTHQFCVLGEQKVDFLADDGLGNVRTEVISLVVKNKAPIANAGDEIVGQESVEIQLKNAGFTDSGLFGHQAEINWGEGSGFEPVALGNPNAAGQCAVQGIVNVKHVYEQDGEYTVTLRVTDAAGVSHENSTIARIANQKPEITVFEPSARSDTFASEGELFLYSGETFELDLEYTDAGRADTHRLIIDWIEEGQSPEVLDLGVKTDVTGAKSVEHVFFKPGTYKIIIALEDEKGGRDTKELSLLVRPLSIMMEFMPSDDENLITPGMSGPLSVILFAGQHELGEYTAEEIHTDTLKLGKGQAGAIRKIYDLMVAVITGNVVANYKDRNNDGKTDVQISFNAEDILLSPEDNELVLMGRFADGRYFAARERLNLARARATFSRILNTILLILYEK